MEVKRQYAYFSAAGCQCGCGGSTGTWPRTDRARGRIKGEARRFIQGHNLPKAAQPRQRVVEEYKRIAERALGKPLPERAIVHHVNENPLDNRNSNLVICENIAYHSLLHRRMLALAECGHADWLKCTHCKTWDSPDNVHRAKRKSYHRSCATEYHKSTPSYKARRVSQ